MEVLHISSGRTTEGASLPFDWSIVPTVEALKKRLPELAPQHQSAQRYPHIVIDDFLPSEVAAAMAADFPHPDDLRVCGIGCRRTTRAGSLVCATKPRSRRLFAG